MSSSTPAVSVIIPTLNEEQRLFGTIAAVRASLPRAEIIVADGGSSDRTVELAGLAGATLVRAPRGRGLQCHAGAAVASGDILLFLHADTTPPADAADIIQRMFARDAVRLGTFRLAFDSTDWFLRACAWFSRLDSVFTRFGDQGIAVRRSFYAEIGGFPPWPLFEDVELLRRARRVTRVWSFPGAVTTSARRFHRRGAFAQQFLNGRLLLRFLLGTPPEALAREYRPEPPSTPQSFSP